MKRSQMIKLIREKLIGTAINGPPLNALSPEFPEQILILVENFGMLPPGTLVKNYEWPDHYIMTDPKTGKKVGARMSNQWEPEDE